MTALDHLCCRRILVARREASTHGLRAGIHWAAVDSFMVQAEATPGRVEVFVLSKISGEPVDSGFRVASQKFAAVAGEVARWALPHTIPAQEEP